MTDHMNDDGMKAAFDRAVTELEHKAPAGAKPTADTVRFLDSVNHTNVSLDQDAAILHDAEGNVTGVQSPVIGSATLVLRISDAARERLGLPHPHRRDQP